MAQTTNPQESLWGIDSSPAIKSYTLSNLRKIPQIEKFSKLARDWWNPEGKFMPLHKFNPIRIKYIFKKNRYRSRRWMKALQN